VKVSRHRSIPVALPIEDVGNGAAATVTGPNRKRIGQRDRRVYAVNDDAPVYDSLIVLLQTNSFAAIAYASGVAFLADERHREAGCLIIDQHMPDVDGLEVLAALQRGASFVPTILISGRLDTAIAERAGKLGVTAILEKLFDVPPRVELVRAALKGPADKPWRPMPGFCDDPRQHPR
jgi:two-component system, LuxR family, response regulator FixJ